MINAVIIDDEPKSVFTLNSFLRDYCPQVNITGIANDAAAAKTLIEKVNPQLVFLDIEMPMGSGFDLLQSLKSIHFEIIFITAYNQYAINAFRFSALDYLLKPLRITELKQAVAKAEQRILEKRSTHDYELMIRNMGEQNTGKLKIAFTDKGVQYLVPLDDIMYCLASANYTYVHTTGKIFISPRNLKEFEEMLPPDIFFRIHHGHIVNTNYITKLQKGRGGSVIMNDGKELEIAVRRKEEFMKKIKN